MKYRRDALDKLPREHTASPLPGGGGKWRSRLGSVHLRDCWWRLLDLFEAHRAARVALYLAAASVVAGGALWFWAYPWWTKRNAIRIAQAWLDSGHLRYAAEAAQRASAVAPERPEPWLIAAELARRGGQSAKALEYSRRAAELAPADPAIVIGWAADALRADQLAEADRVLDGLPVEVQAASPYVQRLRGEMARRELRLTAAKGYFESAQRLEGPLAVNQVPLGLVLLHSTLAAERQRGLNLLARWSDDHDWGALALRTLLDDAFLHDDRPALLQWSGKLWQHPLRTYGDTPQCLRAMARTDESRLAGALATLEKDHAVSPAAATQLISWLNQIGLSAEGVRWMNTLPAAAVRQPPLVVAGAEALRLTADWPALAAWTREGNWGPEVEFLRWAYGLQAARQLKDENRADELWRTLYSHAQLNSAHALFAASSLYSWGLAGEAEKLWWRAGEQEGPNAIEALGALGRYYQVARDAEGQYRVFRQLHLLKPGDPAIGNNFAFFAALTGREQRLAEKVAAANLARESQNPVYVATMAFVLFQQGRTEEAAGLLKPRARDAAASPALGFVYGLSLAATGRGDQARPLLNALPPDSLSLAEVELIRKFLGN
jgi:predicted Zn-dependent protease